MSIPQSFIQELLARADVVDIVGRHVQLKKGGANFMGLCPFHGEKSPSFSVSPTKQFYHCFGCGASGDAIKFLTEYVGMTFMEAVKDLAQQYGLQVPEDDVSPQDRAKAAQMREQQATLSSVLEKAGVAYIRNLRSSERAIDYFKRRGVSGEIAKTFGLGYAPEGWRSWALRTPSPHWVQPARPSMCKSCFASPTRWSSALTATRPAGALRTRPWTPPCPLPATRAPSSFCFCRRSMTPTVMFANMAKRVLLPVSAKPFR